MPQMRRMAFDQENKMNRYALIFTVIALLALLVGTLDYWTAKEIEGIRFECKCKPRIGHRELIASFCDLGDNRGPIFTECLYERREIDPL